MRMSQGALREMEGHRISLGSTIEVGKMHKKKKKAVNPNKKRIHQMKRKNRKGGRPK